jgi:hypothetical protein
MRQAAVMKMNRTGRLLSGGIQEEINRQDARAPRKKENWSRKEMSRPQQCCKIVPDS